MNARSSRYCSKKDQKLYEINFRKCIKRNPVPIFCTYAKFCAILESTNANGEKEMKEFMNPPETWEYSNADIIAEYQNNHDIKKTAKIFDLSVSEARTIVQKGK